MMIAYDCFVSKQPAPTEQEIEYLILAYDYV